MRKNLAYDPNIMFDVELGDHFRRMIDVRAELVQEKMEIENEIYYAELYAKISWKPQDAAPVLVSLRKKLSDIEGRIARREEAIKEFSSDYNL